LGYAVSPSYKAWKYDPEITRFEFSGWFELECFKHISGLPEIVAKWRRMLGNDVACWKGDSELNIRADSHPYLRKMYPFIWIARIPNERIETRTDQISYLVTLFLEWSNKLTGKDLNTSLSINRVVENPPANSAAQPPALQATGRAIPRSALPRERFSSMAQSGYSTATQSSADAAALAAL
jgi:hypothetical protein